MRRRSLISDGLLCAAELKATNATLLTFKSLSVSVRKKSPMLLRNSASIGCGYLKNKDLKLQDKDLSYFNKKYVNFLLLHQTYKNNRGKWFTWSLMVNFIAVTTVVRIRGDGEFNAAWSLGNSWSGSIKQSFPKHSATTFLVPKFTEFIKRCREPNLLMYFIYWIAEDT